MFDDAHVSLVGGREHNLSVGVYRVSSAFDIESLSLCP